IVRRRQAIGPNDVRDGSCDRRRASMTRPLSSCLARVLSGRRTLKDGSDSGGGCKSHVKPTATLELSGSLIEQCGELLRRQNPIALGHKLADLLPIRVVGEKNANAITASSRRKERVADGEQRLAFF